MVLRCAGIFSLPDFRDTARSEIARARSAASLLSSSSLGEGRGYSGSVVAELVEALQRLLARKGRESQQYLFEQVLQADQRVAGAGDMGDVVPKDSGDYFVRTGSRRRQSPRRKNKCSSPPDRWAVERRPRSVSASTSKTIPGSDTQPPPLRITSSARRRISSGNTSSTCVAMCQRLPHISRTAPVRSP